MAYGDLATEMIERETEVLGDRAIDIAQDIEGIDVSDEGRVLAVQGDGPAVIEDLADAYIDILGKATEASLSTIAQRYDDEVELPTNLS